MHTYNMDPCRSWVLLSALAIQRVSQLTPTFHSLSMSWLVLADPSVARFQILWSFQYLAQACGCFGTWFPSLFILAW